MSRPLSGYPNTRVSLACAGRVVFQHFACEQG
jgi:hypothetical protein